MNGRTENSRLILDATNREPILLIGAAIGYIAETGVYEPKYGMCSSGLRRTPPVTEAMKEGEFTI